MAGRALWMAMLTYPTGRRAAFEVTASGAVHAVRIDWHYQGMVLCKPFLFSPPAAPVHVDDGLLELVPVLVG